MDDLSSAHVYLRMKEPISSYEEIPENVLQECLQVTKANSIEGCKKSQVSIIYTWASNLKKTQMMETGAVSFHNHSKVKKVMHVERDRELLR